MIAAMNYAVTYAEHVSKQPFADNPPDWNTWISKLPVAISSGYTAEQMGEAFDAGWNRGVEAASHVMENKHLSDLEILERNIPMVYPDRQTYLSSLPKVKDAGVLETALERIVAGATPENDLQAWSWLDTARQLAAEALTQYNNPDAAAT